MTEQVTELRKEVKTLLAQTNAVIKQNIMLIRELNQLTAEDGTLNTDLVKTTEQFNLLMAKLNIQPGEETPPPENEESDLAILPSKSNKSN